MPVGGGGKLGANFTIGADVVVIMYGTFGGAL